MNLKEALNKYNDDTMLIINLGPVAHYQSVKWFKKFLSPTLLVHATYFNSIHRCYALVIEEDERGFI